MIYVITPVFNRIHFTSQYLNALQKQTTENFKVVIIDDGSTDGTPEMIEQYFPDVILLREKGNLWWAEATNIGVRFAIDHGASYILTLNDDTIPEPDFIEKMLYWSDIFPQSLLGALGLDHINKSIVYGGQNISWKNRTITSIVDNLEEDQMHGLHEVNFFPGRGLLIPKEVFNNIGYYDSKNFPQTVSDLDFTHRAERASYKIFCNYDAKIKMYKHESANAFFKNNKSFKNYIIYLFSKKGGGNLIWFIKYTIKNCPKRYLLLYMLRGLIGRIVGYWRR